MAMMMVPALLMVSTIRFRSFKTIDMGARRGYQVLIGVAGFLALVVTYPHEVLILMAYAYLLSAFIGLVRSRVRPVETAERRQAGETHRRSLRQRPLATRPAAKWRRRARDSCCSAAQPNPSKSCWSIPGGPFWAQKDDGAWSIPKGEFPDDEEPLAAAISGVRRRNRAADAPATSSRSSPCSRLAARSCSPGPCAPTSIRRNFAAILFQLEWPRRSGRQREFPEVDRAAWFDLEARKQKILKGQVAAAGSARVAAVRGSADRDRRPQPWLGVHGNRSAVGLDVALGDRQTQARFQSHASRSTARRFAPTRRHPSRLLHRPHGCERRARRRDRR